MNNTKPLSGLTIYHVLIEAWSGTVKVARESDLSGVELPPKSIMDDGRKHLVPKTLLADLEKIRGAVHRMFAKEGFRLVGGFAVPNDRVAEIEGELGRLNTDFNRAVDQIAANLETAYLLQEQAHPAWAEVLRRGRLTPDQVRARCRFAVAAVAIAEPAGEAAGRFANVVSEAVPALVRSVAEEASELLERISARGGTASTRAVAATRRMLEKLQRFSFLDPRVDPVVTAITGQIDRIVTTDAKLSPAEKAILVMVLSTMADPGRFIDLTPEELSDAAEVHVPVVGSLFQEQPLAINPGVITVTPVAGPEMPTAPAWSIAEMGAF